MVRRADGEDCDRVRVWLVYDDKRPSEVLTLFNAPVNGAQAWVPPTREAAQA